MSKIIKAAVLTAFVVTGATAAHAGGWGSKGGTYGSYNHHSNSQLLNVSPNVNVGALNGGILNGAGIVSGNSTSVLNGVGLLNGNRILGGNTQNHTINQNRNTRFGGRR